MMNTLDSSREDDGFTTKQVQWLFDHVDSLKAKVFMLDTATILAGHRSKTPIWFWLMTSVGHWSNNRIGSWPRLGIDWTPIGSWLVTSVEHQSKIPIGSWSMTPVGHRPTILEGHWWMPLKGPRSKRPREPWSLKPNGQHSTIRAKKTFHDHMRLWVIVQNKETNIYDLALENHSWREHSIQQERQQFGVQNSDTEVHYRLPPMDTTGILENSEQPDWFSTFEDVKFVFPQILPPLTQSVFFVNWIPTTQAQVLNCAARSSIIFSTQLHRELLSTTQAHESAYPLDNQPRCKVLSTQQSTITRDHQPRRTTGWDVKSGSEVDLCATQHYSETVHQRVITTKQAHVSHSAKHHSRIPFWSSSEQGDALDKPSVAQYREDHDHQTKALLDSTRPWEQHHHRTDLDTTEIQ